MYGMISSLMDMIRIATREKYSYHYNNNIESKWALIEPIIKDIRVGKSQSLFIIRIQFPI